MKDLGWTVTTDVFEEITPISKEFKEFTNIIATLNPDASQRLLVSCHYDSKYFPDENGQVNNFVGATDSAVPCAMMINIAYVLYSYLMPIKQVSKQYYIKPLQVYSECW